MRFEDVKNEINEKYPQINFYELLIKDLESDPECDDSLDYVVWEASKEEDAIYSVFSFYDNISIVRCRKLLCSPNKED